MNSDPFNGGTTAWDLVFKRPNNYAKPSSAKARHLFFPFYDGDPFAAKIAINAARAVARRYKNPMGHDVTEPIAVFRLVPGMPTDVQCIGHAPRPLYSTSTPMGIIGHRCENCGTIYSKE